MRKITKTTKFSKIITSLLCNKFSSWHLNCVPLTSKILPHNKSAPTDSRPERVKRAVIYNNRYLQIVAETRTFASVPRLRTALTMTINSCLMTLVVRVSFRAHCKCLSIYLTQTIVGRKKFYTSTFVIEFIHSLSPETPQEAFVEFSPCPAKYKTVCINTYVCIYVYIFSCSYTLAFALAHFFNKTKKKFKKKIKVYFISLVLATILDLYSTVHTCAGADCVCEFALIHISFACSYHCWLPHNCVLLLLFLLAHFSTSFYLLLGELGSTCRLRYT